MSEVTVAVEARALSWVATVKALREAAGQNVLVYPADGGENESRHVPLSEWARIAEALRANGYRVVEL